MTRLTHGRAGTTEYNTWSTMKARCLNPNNPSYSEYGGRGIAICQEWQDSFAAFFAYMGPKPSPDYSIDRIDNDGNYEPGNVRWATRTEQHHNRRPRDTWKRRTTKKAPTENLSPRMIEILRLAAGRMTLAEIATRLGTTRPTVATHLANVYRRLGVKTRKAAVAAAQQRGLIPAASRYVVPAGHPDVVFVSGQGLRYHYEVACVKLRAGKAAAQVMEHQDHGVREVRSGELPASLTPCEVCVHLEAA